MRYTWPQTQQGIHEIRFSFDKKTAPEALIFASPSGLGAAANVDKLLTENGFAVSYDVVMGRPALRVHDFRHSADILSLLENNEITSGTPAITKTRQEKPPMNRFVGAAIFYELGNISGLLGGLLRKDKDERDSNLAFLIGDSFMLAFGRKTREEKQISIMQGFGSILKNNGIAVDDGSAFATQHTANLPGMWNSVRHWMHDKVILVKSVSEIAAGYKKFASGSNQNNLYKQVSGAAVIAGYSSSLMIKEKNRSQLREEFGVDTNEEVQQRIKKLPLLKRAWIAIEQQPLFVSGGGAAIYNLAGIFGALDERKHHRQIKKLETELGVAFENTTSDAIKIGNTYTQSLFGIEIKRKIDGKPALSELQDARTAYSARRSTSNRATLVAAENRVNELKTKLVGAKDAKNKNLWVFDLAQSVFFAAANYLYGTASKNGDPEDQKKLTDRFFAAAASEIVKAPFEQQQYLLGIASQYAGTTRDFNLTAKESREILENKIQHLESNPWLRKRKGLATLENAASLSVPQELLKQPVAETLDAPMPPVKEGAEHSFVSNLGAHSHEHRRGILTNPLESFTHRYDAEPEMGGVIGF